MYQGKTQIQIPVWKKCVCVFWNTHKQHVSQDKGFIFSSLFMRIGHVEHVGVPKHRGRRLRWSYEGRIWDVSVANASIHHRETLLLHENHEGRPSDAIVGEPVMKSCRSDSFSLEARFLLAHRKPSNWVILRCPFYVLIPTKPTNDDQHQQPFASSSSETPEEFPGQARYIIFWVH